jgi:hypothetical protein
MGTIGSFYTKSGKQKLVATSSTHAEMRALYTCVLDIIVVINLCAELHRPLTLPCIVMEDNSPVIILATDFSANNKRSKHFAMLTDYIKEQVNNGIIALSKVATTSNYADVLSKIVVGNEFRAKALHILGYPLDL